MFFCLFGSYIFWLLSAFWTERKTFYTVVVFQRALLHLVCALHLRSGLLAAAKTDGDMHSEDDMS